MSNVTPKRYRKNEEAVRGTSSIRPDTDGDGLPDGWEVRHGFDPLAAQTDGTHGAGDDPDGDGLTNLQEFQMDGDPTNPAINAAQLIYRLMHCRRGSSLRVGVGDSENCGGSNPDRQEAEDVFNVGPLMHSGYLLALTVEGQVEDHNSGYDKVSMRSYTATELQSEVPFFGGHNNGNECSMVAEQATTNVWFWSNGSVRLRYDTVDGRYHTDAYAELAAAAFVREFKMEIEVNDTADKDDDLVCRYSANPAGRPTIPCRARVQSRGPGDVPVVLTGDKLRFSGEADTTKRLLLPEDGAWVGFDISGQIGSNFKNDAEIEAHLSSAAGCKCGSADLTVLWVAHTRLRNAQDALFAADNASELKPNPARLGLQQLVADPTIPTLAHVVEIAAEVYPLDFEQDVEFTRDNIDEFIAYQLPPYPPQISVNNTGIARGEGGGNDPANPGFLDKDPRPYGRIYDWDTPGHATGDFDEGKNNPQGILTFIRYNFLQYAMYNGVRCSDDFAWYVRLTSEKTSPPGTGNYVHHTRPGHPADNAAGAGSTTMSVD